MQKCISNVAASQENQSITPEESHLCAQLALQLCWQILATQPHPIITNPPPSVQDAARTAVPPKLCSQHMRWHRVPAVPPHLQFHSWEHLQLVPALTTALRRDMETRMSPTQPHRAIKDVFLPKAV